MPLVKLNSTVLDSSLWIDIPGRNVFLTALLMARPITTERELATYNVHAFVEEKFTVPTGLYGFVEASGKAIAAKTGFAEDMAMKALERLCSPDPDSRSKAWEGRRMVRVEGGYILLNYAAFYEKDLTAADRQRRHREKKKPKSKMVGKVQLKSWNEFDIFWEAYPRKEAKAVAQKSWNKLMPLDDAEANALIEKIITALEAHKRTDQWTKDDGKFIPYPATWLNQRRWEDEVTPATKSSDDIQGSWKTVRSDEQAAVEEGSEAGQAAIHDDPFSDLD